MQVQMHPIRSITYVGIYEEYGVLPIRIPSSSIDPRISCHPHYFSTRVVKVRDVDPRSEAYIPRKGWR